MEVAAFATGEPLTHEQLAEAPLRSLPRPSALAQELDVKPKRAERAAEALGLHTVADLIEHFPRDHADRREAGEIATLPVGDDVTVVAEVRRISSRRARGRLTLQEATVSDHSGPMKAVWFNQPWLVDKLPAGTRVVLHGKYNGPRRGLSVKDYEVAPDATSAHST
ncbi:MAG: ATP-dependent helicase RecG, partial [Thermoleophilaceae bacterium]|nr:ATP-dependent helicase RecG [Thermoleophilaceae bacterium]